MLSKHAIGRCVSLLVGGCVLLSAATAQAEFKFSKPPAQVDAIEQWRETNPSAGLGSTYVHLRGVRCAGVADGYYQIKLDDNQPHMLELLLSSLSSPSRLVTINHNPSTCVISGVRVCTTPRLCN